MASIRERGNLFYLQWYDSITKKVRSETTGLEVNEANRKLVKKYAKELQQELTKRSKDLKRIGAKSITIRGAFDHFLKNNQNKHWKTRKDYWRFYKKFIEYFDENQPCTNITKVDVEDWLNMIKQLPQQKCKGSREK